MDFFLGSIFEFLHDLIPFMWISDAASKHLGYIIELEEILNDLTSETNELKRKRDEVEEDVKAAESIGKKKLRRVENWLNDVHKIVPQVESIKLEFDNQGICNPFLRLRLGKRVAEKIKDVKKLNDKGDFDEVAKIPYQPPSNQRIWEAQSAENVYLATAVRRMEAEIASCQDRLAKLEAEVSSMKAQQEALSHASDGAAAAMPSQTTNRGRARRAGRRQI